jgi:putative Holliday junction resolvase
VDTHDLSQVGRVAAIDYGRRRIGVAVSDPTQTIASPHSAFLNKAPAASPPTSLIADLEKLDLAGILIGVPLQMDGGEGEMAAEARLFGRILAERLGVHLVEWDERLSSVDARRELLRLGVPRKKRRRKGTEDVMAATLMLRDYLGTL